jgi:hypothetical protein
MKPDVSDILNITAEQSMAAIVSAAAPHYVQGATAVHGLLLRFAAREYERGADIRARENADIRALFAELSGEVREASLQTQIKDAAASRDTSLTISALDASNAELRKLLIALHVHVEENGLRAAEKRIWQLLKTIAARRAMPLF